MSLIARFVVFLCGAAFGVVAAEPPKQPDGRISEATIRDLLVKGLEADSAKDLDAPIAKLAALQKHAQADVNHLDPNFGLVQAAAGILIAYQDGLLGNKAQGYNSPIERLQQMASGLGSSFAELIPRSELMEKIRTACERISGASAPEASEVPLEKKINDLIRGIKKVEAMDSAMTQIDALEARSRESGQGMVDQNVITLFRDYYRTYQELRDGQATSMNFSSSYASYAGSDVMWGVRDLLIRYALPRVLATPPDLVQKEGEPIAGFLQRVITTARTASNWPLLARTLNTTQAMGLDTLASSEDSNGLRNFLGGINQEQARFWSGAVSSYLAALKSGSQLVPADYIGKRLDEIRQSHPEDYDAGTKAPPTVERPVSPFLSRQRTLPIPALPKPNEAPPAPKSSASEEKPKP